MEGFANATRESAHALLSGEMVKKHTSHSEQVGPVKRVNLGIRGILVGIKDVDEEIDVCATLSGRKMERASVTSAIVKSSNSADRSHCSPCSTTIYTYCSKYRNKIQITIVHHIHEAQVSFRIHANTPFTPLLHYCSPHACRLGECYFPFFRIQGTPMYKRPCYSCEHRLCNPFLPVRR